MESRLREEINRLHAHVCNGLADPNRILLLYTLSKSRSSVNDLAEQLEISQPSVSRHLKILRERGLVSARRDGQFVYYEIADPRIIAALDLLRAVMADNLKEQANLTNLIED